MLYSRVASTLRQAGQRACLARSAVASSARRGFTSQAGNQATMAGSAKALLGAAALATVGGLWYASQASSSSLFSGYSQLDADSRTPVAGIKGSNQERTFIAVKPDGVQRGLVGDVIRRFEARGYKLVGLKLLVPSKKLAEKHYEDLSNKPFYKGLVDYMTNGKAPVVAMVWEGPDVIRQGRKMLGATNPLDAAPGTIRSDYCTSIGRNIIHGSDSFDSALKEITLWFNENEVHDWTPANVEWVISAN